MAAAPHPIVVNLFGLGLVGWLLALFSLGVYRGLEPSPRVLVGSTALGLAGGGLVVAGAFPFPDPVHLIAASCVSVCGAASMLLLAGPLSRDPRWRWMKPYSVLAALLALHGLVIATHPWPLPGLAQRIDAAAGLTWIVLAAVRLLRAPLPPLARPRAHGRLRS